MLPHLHKFKHLEVHRCGQWSIKNQGDENQGDDKGDVVQKIQFFFLLLLRVLNILNNVPLSCMTAEHLFGTDPPSKIFPRYILSADQLSDPMVSSHVPLIELLPEAIVPLKVIGGDPGRTKLTVLPLIEPLTALLSSVPEIVEPD